MTIAFLLLGFAGIAGARYCDPWMSRLEVLGSAAAWCAIVLICRA